MPIVPGRFDQHPAEVGIPGLGDAPSLLARAAGIFRRDQAREPHHLPGACKPRRIPELGGNRQGGEVVDPPEAAESRHARRQRLDRERGLQIRVDRAQASDAVIDRPSIGRERLLERRERSALPREPYPEPL